MSAAERPRIDVFQDVLDKQLIGRSGEKVGKADGLIAEDSTGRIVAIEAGLPTLARRLHAGWGRAVERLAARIRAPLLRSARVSFREVLDIGIEVKLDVDGKKSPLRAGERWLSDSVVGRIPGAGAGPRAGGGDARPPVRVEESPGEVRLELALGRRVRAKNNRSIGRLEEIRAEKRGAEWFAREVRIGPAALLERLAAGTTLLGRREPRGRVALWSEVDFSDPRRPRLRVAASDLRPLPKEEAVAPPGR